GVVDRPGRVLRQVGVAESGVGQRFIAELPGLAPVVRGPDPDVVLVAIGGRQSGTEELLDRYRPARSIDVGRALVRGVDEVAEFVAMDDPRLATGSNRVDEDRCPKARWARRGGRRGCHPAPPRP